MKKNGNSTNGSKPKKPERYPDISALLKAIAGSTNSELWHNSYLSRGTIANLRKRVTKRPNHMTMTGIAAARGLRYKLVRNIE